MSETSWQDEASTTTRVMQIIVAAMTAGTVVFLGIALTVVAARAKPPQPLLPFSITLVAIILAAVELAARQVVVWATVSKARREIARGVFRPVAPRQTIDGSGKPLDDGRCLLQVFATKTIISAALFEGVAFLATLAYLVEGSPIALGLAVFLILAVASHFPTRSHIVNWVDRQLEAVQQERMMP